MMQRKMLVRLARKQQMKIQTKALLVWKLVLIARGLFEHHQKQINARLPGARAQQHLLRSLAARMQVHVEATLRLLGAFGFLPSSVAAELKALQLLISSVSADSDAVFSS